MAYLRRAHTMPVDATMAPLLREPDAAIRVAIVHGVRGLPGAERAFATIANDPDAYVRALATWAHARRRSEPRPPTAPPLA